MTPKKYPQNRHTPKNIHFSENPQKLLKFQNFEPKKNSPNLRMCENIRVPSPPPPPLGLLMHKRPLFYPKESYRPTSERSFERRRWWHDIMLTGFRNLTE